MDFVGPELAMTVEIEQQCLVVGAYSRRMTLQLKNQGEVEARIKGKKLKPVCGDRVMAEPIPNEPEWLITQIFPRTNELTRPDSRGRKDILAANVDCVVAMAAIEPEPDWYIVDRYLAAAEIMGASSIVVLNKTDLRPISNATISVLDDYLTCGIDVIQCSATTGSNIDTLVAAMKNKISIIVGQSGVGKSSVINRIVYDGAQRIGNISDSTGEGRHTTVNSVMLDLPDGGAVIDSPGVRDYAPSIENQQDVNRGFREIQHRSRDCRFANCVHLREPGCAVKSGVEAGDVSARRYESYKRLMNSSQRLSDKFG
ncbi:MAG: ribosome small subunit-dependent GTPase A [Woeseiaceae bacterium]